MYISRDNESAADQVQSAIYEGIELVAQSPNIGHLQTDLTKTPILVWTIPAYSNYQILYDIRFDHVRILRVLHGARWKVWKQL